MDKAKETFSKFLGNARERWGGLGRPAKVGIVASVAAVIIAIVVVSIISSQTGYVVLYAGQSADERNEVTRVLSEDLGITEWRVNGNNIEVSSELEKEVRWQLAMKGYPKTSYGFSHFNDRVSITSTESEKKEYLRQNLALNIKATLEIIPEVKQAIVNISPVEDEKYALSTSDMTSSASVMLELFPGKTLTAEQIEGVYNYVMTAYAGFSRDRITVTDGNGVRLTPESNTSTAQELALLERQMSMLDTFRQNFEASLEDDLEALFATMFKKVAVNVSAQMDFGNTHSESVVYSPSVAEDGTRGGMIDNEKDNTAWGGMTPEGGMVGAPVDADIAPDNPTLVADADTEIFYERVREIQYKVNQEISTYDSAPFTVQRISAAIVVDEGTLTPDEIERLEQLAADTIGTFVDTVTVVQRVLPLDPSGSTGDLTIPAGTNRNMLIFVIVMLGALLIVLFFLGIVTASSKKKRMVRSKLAPAGAYGGASGSSLTGPDYESLLFGPATAQKVTETETEEPFKLQSLLANDTESHEAALKAEIKEFTKTNPEIVAQLIRTWMKETV